jgi:hypothetical protein
MSEGRKKLANIKLTGTQEEIASTKALLVFRGWDWVTTGTYYPRDDDPSADKFVHFLRDVSAPLEPPLI